MESSSGSRKDYVTEMLGKWGMLARSVHTSKLGNLQMENNTTKKKIKWRCPLQVSSENMHKNLYNM